MALKRGYRHYNLLIDIFFWISLASSIRVAFRLMGYDLSFGFAVLRVAILVLGLAGIVSIFALIGLIVIGGLRDEYAERLWAKAASACVRFLPLFPLLWLAGFFLFADLGGGMDWLRANPDFSLVPPQGVFPNPSGSIGVHQIEGINYSVLQLFTYFPLTFVAIYKWYRWRDERG